MIQSSPGSVWLRAGEPHHIGPPFGFGYRERGEFGLRQRHWHSRHVCETRLHKWARKSGIDLAIQLLNDFMGRSLWDSNPRP
jgi:hypothetical protein